MAAYIINLNLKIPSKSPVIDIMIIHWQNNIQLEKYGLIVEITSVHRFLEHFMDATKFMSTANVKVSSVEVIVYQLSEMFTAQELF